MSEHTFTKRIFFSPGKLFFGFPVNYGRTRNFRNRKTLFRFNDMTQSLIQFLLRKILIRIFLWFRFGDHRFFLLRRKWGRGMVLRYAYLIPSISSLEIFHYNKNLLDELLLKLVMVAEKRQELWILFSELVKSWFESRFKTKKIFYSSLRSKSNKNYTRQKKKKKKNQLQKKV